MPITREATATAGSELAALIGEYAERDGGTPSPLPGVRFYRVSRPTTRAAMVCRPSIILVAQGRKQVSVAGEEHTCGADRYLILSVPLPIHSRVQAATPEAPYLAMQILIDPAELSALVLELDDSPRPAGALRPAIGVSSMSAEFAGAAVRLLRALSDPVDRRILAPLCIREILYRSLAGTQGEFLRALALRHGQHHRMARVLNLIHTRHDDALDVPALAGAAHMSVSAFHRNFKAVTSHTPLQYVKTIRLHRARALMLLEGLNASDAARRVGYRSASQFSREFRRLFGLPPTEEIARLRASGEEVEG